MWTALRRGTKMNEMLCRTSTLLGDRQTGKRTLERDTSNHTKIDGSRVAVLEHGQRICSRAGNVSRERFVWGKRGRKKKFGKKKNG